ncbi:dihydropteroate synthase [Diaminobutyricimonas aerilata]|uniref:Dihydropteroate synthase n=1 Tax=Diaminobutyricimonas aerilata TaxID=1162967 RepID=A0A2M9CNC6_9MICO|nr:dihydropteroate synthase [Diaminobutyricimonas aerilata]PJJ73409.1 dihydropteroate synthase [Diaminobutyricimonas aerilata]
MGDALVQQDRTGRSRRTSIMGVLNVTPDSFSDGGRFDSADDAIARGLELVEQGADVVDVGGESTRPGADRVPVEEEQRRVIPVVRALAERGVAVSVDTMNSATAVAAIAAGARYINDVSGGLADPEMHRVIAESDAVYIASHWRGHSATMNKHTQYADVVREVHHTLALRASELIIRGVPVERIVLDPGLGFAKKARHNWALLGHLGELVELGFPVLVGASRKRFLGKLLDPDAPVTDRDAPTAIVSALAAREGAWAVRVHDVPGTRAALAVAEAWRQGALA